MMRYPGDTRVYQSTRIGEDWLWSGMGNTQKIKIIREPPAALPSSPQVTPPSPSAIDEISMSRFVPDAVTILKAVFYLSLSSVAVGGALLYAFQTSLIYPSYVPQGEPFTPSSSCSY